MDLNKVLLYPMMGEKATMLREMENKLTFIVSKESTKKDIRDAIESLYDVEILDVNTLNTMDGKKKAHIKLSEKFSAEEVASQFGVL